MAVNCVNTKTKEFKEAAHNLNISEATLETIVFDFQNTEGNENKFPDDSYIVSKLYGEREEVGKNVFDLYQQEYQQPKVFLTREALQEGMAEATQYFHPKSVTAYQNSDGKYTMVVAKPKLKAEDRTDYNKKDISTARKSLIQNYKESINMADRQAAFDTAIISITDLFSNYTPSSKDAFDINNELTSKADDIESKFSDYIEAAKFVSVGNGKFRLEITPKSFNSIMDELITDHINNMSEERVISELEANEMGISFDMEYHLNRKKEEEARRVIAKKNTKITQEELDSAIEFLKSLENNPDLNQYVSVCINWLKDNKIRLPEDNEKLMQSFLEARKLGLDTSKFKEPIELLAEVAKAALKNGAIDGEPIDPSNFDKFTFNREVITDKGKIQIYDVEDSVEGQTQVCQVLATCSPKSEGKAITPSPWCLSTYNYNANTGKATPTNSAQNTYWGYYNKGKRQIAIMNGYPIAFNSTDYSDGRDQWWDFSDSPHQSIEEVNPNLTFEVYNRKKEALTESQYKPLANFESQGVETKIYSSGKIIKERKVQRIQSGTSTYFGRDVIISTSNGELGWAFNNDGPSSQLKIGFFTIATFRQNTRGLQLNMTIAKAMQGLTEGINEGAATSKHILNRIFFRDTKTNTSYSAEPILEVNQDGELVLSLRDIREGHNNYLGVQTLGVTLGKLPKIDKFVEFLERYLSDVNLENIGEKEELPNAFLKDFSNLEALSKEIDKRAQEELKEAITNYLQGEEKQIAVSPSIDQILSTARPVEENLNETITVDNTEIGPEFTEDTGINTREVEEEINQNNILNELEQALDPARNYEYSVEEYAEYGETAEYANDNSDIDAQVTIDDVKDAAEILKEGKLQQLYNEKIKKEVNKELEQTLKSILSKYHFESLEGPLKDVFGEDVLGALDILQKIVYLAEEKDRNLITQPEEFAHAFIELMGSRYRREETRDNHPENKLYSELRDMVVNTSLYKQVLNQYKDTYVLRNGNTDTAKVAKEALGQALAAVITDRFEAKTSEDRTFLRKLKEWFKNILTWFKGQANLSDEDKLIKELNKIANSILDGTYASKYLKDSGIDKLEQQNFDKTVREQTKKDGGKALAIMSILREKGLIIGGSMALRAQGTLYRKSQDSLHDLDYSVDPAIHNITGINGFGQRNFFGISKAEAAHIKDVVENSQFMTDLVASIPGATVAATYTTGINIITNIVISDNAEAKAKFLSQEGSYSDRLNQLSQKERDSIYLLDIFINPYTNKKESYNSEELGQVDILSAESIFEAKLKMGRTKDVRDYQNYNPANRTYRISNRGIMFETTTADSQYEAELNNIKQQAIADGTFMKAPNGNPTNLNERQWLQVRTQAFKEWFGDWQKANDLYSNLNNVDTSEVDIVQEDKPWRERKDGKHLDAKGNWKSNKTLRFYLKGDRSKGYFELVKDEEFGQYSIHLKTNNGRYGNNDVKASTKEERVKLYRALIQAIPEGAIVSTWGKVSEGGVGALNKIGESLTKIGEREVTSKETGEKITIPIYQKGEGVSKVVDENGEPLVVYHNSDNKFTEFDPTKIGSANDLGFYGSGFYFTKNKDYASSYGENTYEVFLNIRDPFIANSTESSQASIMFNREDDSLIDYAGENYGNYQNNIESADGIIHDGPSYYRGGQHIQEYVVKNPNQVKSATGNIGTFSKEDSNIYFQKAPIKDSGVRKQISYTTKDKNGNIKTREFTVDGNRIINKNGEEIYKHDGKDRNKILGKYAVKTGTAVVVSAKGRQYIVHNDNKIIDADTGHRQKWGEENGLRKQILEAAQIRFEEKAKAQEAKPQAAQTQAPKFKGKMIFSFGSQKRAGVTATNTLDAIINGERTATTRYTSDGNISYWQQAKVGDTIEFEGADGKKALVRVTKPLTLLPKTTTAEEWTSKEGWSEKRFNERVKPQIDKGEAYQMEFEYIGDKATDAETDLANALMSQSNQPMSSYVNHSGGAKGSDSYWGEIGEKYGIKSNHYHAQGERTATGNTPLTQQQLVEADEHLRKANEKLGRTFPAKSNFINNLLRRNWYQVKNSDAIFAIGHLSKGIVDGGTGWAVQMAIDNGKPVYVFDQVRNQWYKNIDGKWSESEVPTLTPNFAGIGTRELNSLGEKAIESVYSKTAQSLNSGRNREIERKEKGLNKKDNPENFNDKSESKGVMSSDRTILSNEELAYWNQQGVDSIPRILTASERTDPAFHVQEILDILEGKKKVPQWGVVNGARAVTGYITGKDFAGLYLITKHDGLPMKRLLETKIPKLIHFSITGLGGTAYEPGVMHYNDLLDRIEDYIKQGLDPKSVTVRIDPIVPGVTKAEDIENIVRRASEMGIKRIKFSVMDAYANTVEALNKLGYDFDTYYGKYPNGKVIFHAKQEYINEIVDIMLNLGKKYDVKLSTCAEGIAREGISKEGCLSVGMVNEMLGTQIEDKGTENNTQRALCSCYGGKIDALAYAKTCASHCMYCYAKHENDKTLQYYNEDGTIKDTPLTRTREESPFKPSFHHERVKQEPKQPQGKNKTYMDKTTKISYEIDALYNSDRMSATEVTEVAKEVMYWISDFLTELQTNPEFAKQKFGDKFEGKDLSKMKRVDIINMITISELLNMAKEHFDPAVQGEGGFKYNDIGVMLQMQEIVANWDGIVTIGAATFSEIEKINIVNTDDGVVTTATEAIEQDPDDYSNTDTPEGALEENGTQADGWQIDTKTRGMLETMSPLVKHAYRECYVLTDTGRVDKDGKPVYEKVQSARGVNQRVGIREVNNQIQRWAQGAFTISQVLAKLEAKKKAHPWVSQIIDKLSDTSGEYSTFQSQFITNLRTFQNYYIVSEDAGKLISKPANRNPVLSTTIRSIKYEASQNMHNLFHHGQINQTSYNELVKASAELFRHRKDDISNPESREVIATNLGYAANILGLPVTAETISEILTDQMFKDSLEKLQQLIKFNLEPNLNKTDYDPFKAEQGRTVSKFEGNLRGFLKPILEYFNDTMENAVNEGGKTYQSFVIPSYLSMMFQRIREGGEEADKYIDREWGKYSFFKTQKGGRGAGWLAPWIGELARDSEARKVFDHKVQLSFNKKGYSKAQYMKSMNDADYLLSVLSEYFSEKDAINLDRVPAWFRVPIQSNKPSSEFIKFYSERGKDYQDTIVEGLKNIFNQELLRIRTVELRNLTDKDHDFIKNFDTKGREFCFLDYMNDYLIRKDNDGNLIMPAKGNTRLAKLIREFLDGNTKNQSELYTEAKKVIKQAMQEKAASIIAEYKTNGIIDAVGKKIKLGRFETAEEALENFIWNDTFATLNIYELTVADLAFYKDTEDLQKRFAQIHAPGIRGNRDARDLEGNPVTDGFFRMVTLKDLKNYKSNIIDNISVAFERKIERARKEGNANAVEGFKILKDFLVGKDGVYRGINVTDAQAFNCPSSYRKKALTMGKWDREAEDLYKKILDGTASYSDIQRAFQPRKPFGYSQIEKPSGISEEYAMNLIKDPIQYKNSEYLLIMADAITRGEDTGMPNLLKTLYDVMEESHYTTDKDGNRVYSTKGIDTIMFNSAVKSGETGSIALKEGDIDFTTHADGENLFRSWLNSHIYLEDGSYNLSTVDMMPVEDYCEQQEIPEHFQEHDQARGSQVTAITISELEATTKDSEGNTIPVTYALKDSKGNVRQVDAQTFKKDYEKTCSDGIEASLEELRKELCLDSESKLERNLAISKILQAEITKNFSRYGIDMWLACTVNKETGDFRIPLGDSSQAKRVEQLINSVIKNRVNKQTMPGGPVVQVTNFGTSRQLHIRFKNRNGGLLMARDQYEKNPIMKDSGRTVKRNLSEDEFEGTTFFVEEGDKYYWYGEGGERVELTKEQFEEGVANKTVTIREAVKTKVSYEDYINENQGGIAHFEVFAPAYMKDMLRIFTDNKGNIDFNAIEMVNPDLLKMIGYRIPTEDKYSSVPCKIVGFLPREAGDAIMMPYDITSITGCDFDVDKMYTILKSLFIATKYSKFDNAELAPEEMAKFKKEEADFIKTEGESLKKFIRERLALKPSAKKLSEIFETNNDYKYEIEAAEKTHRENLEEIESGAEFSRDINDELKSNYEFNQAKYATEKAENELIKEENKRYERQIKRIKQKYINKAINEKIQEFLDEQLFNNSLSDNALEHDIRQAYYDYTYRVYEPMIGKEGRDNHLFDMMYEVLTHETSVDKILNPQGFEPEKKIAYAIEAYRQYGDQYTWKEIMEIANKPGGVDKLKSMISESKNLAYIDTQIQFYKQNAAAGSLIGIFAVHRIAHAILESESPDGSALYYVDVDTVCGLKSPFMVAGKVFGDKMPFSKRYDDSGERIGKVLGSLVGASADAVKDPILNLMNISKETANVLNTLIKMGMPFDNAALFLSQKIISDMLNEFNKANLLGHTSLKSVIEKKVAALEKDLKAKDSKLDTEDITVDSLIEGLRDSTNKERNYKVLRAFLNFQKIAETMKMPMAVTRKNSITSATGPLIIDNIMTEMKEAKLGEISTIMKRMPDGTLRSVSMEEIYKNHPILDSYRKGYDIAREVFRDMPAMSSGFNRIVSIAVNTNLADAFINDRQLMSSLSDFFQTYMCMAAGVIDMSKAKEFLSEFPKEFMQARYKEQYRKNALIQSLQVNEDDRGRMILTLNTTGLQGTSIAKYQDAWTDLHKQNPELSINLWKYCVYSGGIGFNPKTFLNCLPVYVKERIPGYINAFRHIPEVDASNVLDQFIRNNVGEDKLVPWKRKVKLVPGTNVIDEEDSKGLRFTKRGDTIELYDKEQIKEMEKVPYFKMKFGKFGVILYRRTSQKNYNGHIFYKPVPILGLDGYMDMSLSSKDKEALENRNIEDLNRESQADQITNRAGTMDIDSDSLERTPEELRDMMYQAVIIDGVRNEEQAKEWIKKKQNYSEARKKKEAKNLKEFFRRQFTKKNIPFTEKIIDDIMKQENLC